jgi:hypothetical protein
MGDQMQYVFLGLSLLTAVAHILLAMGVWTNASERERDQKPIMYVGPGTWALATLVSGVLGVIAYWLIHHSALRKLYTKEGKAHED